uniref:Uncharacterized protein n=1 Tax=Triticum urartu TaxID=4572 RepID=A0A8R7R3L1_TRIUA
MLQYMYTNNLEHMDPRLNIQNMIHYLFIQNTKVASVCCEIKLK